MRIVGVDLSGPTNTADTALAVFREGTSGLVLVEAREGIGDAELFALPAGLGNSEPCVVALDAPLSYQPGGGDRPADKALRVLCQARGLPGGSVMTPTQTRMAYLTLRGMAVARLLEAAGVPRRNILEAHPGAALALGGAPIAQVRALKQAPEGRERLLAWLEVAGLSGLGASGFAGEHFVAACGCVLAAWKWYRGESAWFWPADPPHHPYAFVA